MGLKIKCIVVLTIAKMCCMRENRACVYHLSLGHYGANSLYTKRASDCTNSIGSGRQGTSHAQINTLLLSESPHFSLLPYPMYSPGMPSRGRIRDIWSGL